MLSIFIFPEGRSSRRHKGILGCRPWPSQGMAPSGEFIAIRPSPCMATIVWKRKRPSGEGFQRDFLSKQILKASEGACCGMVIWERAETLQAPQTPRPIKKLCGAT